MPGEVRVFHYEADVEEGYIRQSYMDEQMQRKENFHEAFELINPSHFDLPK